jgi:hypothetical protein
MVAISKRIIKALSTLDFTLRKSLYTEEASWMAKFFAFVIIRCKNLR